MHLLKRPLFALFALFVVVLGAPAAVPAAASDFAEGLLWKVERPGKAPSWIFGTFHSADPEILALPEAVTTALASATSLSVELVLTGMVPHRLMEAMRAPAGQGLDQTLPPALLDTVLGMAADYGLTAEQAIGLKPWAVSMMLSGPPSEHNRQASGQVPLDMWLQQEATRTRKHLYGLETAEEQIYAFDGLPLEIQVAMLEESLAIPVEEAFGALRRLYVARDLAGLDAFFDASLAMLDETQAALIRERIIDDRNKIMLKRMAARLAEGNSFIAVGALHLPGEKGLLHMLENKGYTVTRLY